MVPKRDHPIKIRFDRSKIEGYQQNTVTNTDHLKNIKKNIDSIASYGYRPYQIFLDWIELMFWAFQRNDPKYLKVINKYDNTNKDPDKRPANIFANTLACLLLHMKLTNEETIGSIYTEYSMNERTGQYFTPPTVTNMMSKMMLPNRKKISGRIYDPACGAGGCLIAMAKNMTNAEIDKSFFVGQDIDFTCVQMTALNLMFFNLNGMVIWGNTLTVEAKKIFQTKRSYLYGGSLSKVRRKDTRLLRSNMLGTVDK